ncbi:MAG: threonine/serine exporter [Oscillospiraceae bacterium]|nr:threonine/serine exporter [Oscillospiraceae bacterium]
MWVQLLTAFLGAMGFAILYHIRGIRLWAASLGGLLSWGFYLWVEHLGGSVLIVNILAAAFSAAYAEVLARILKSPATIFVIPAVIPLVPGGALYYAMYSAVTGDAAALSRYSYETWNAAMGIAIGIAGVTSVCHLLAVRRRKRT